MSVTFALQNSSFKVHQVSLDGTPWFRGKDVANFLGYSNTKQASDNKRLLCEVCSRVLNANEKNTVYINEAGVRRLVIKSQKPQASKLAKELGIKEETRYLRKEIEIVGFIQQILTQVTIPFEFQKSVANYRIDL